MRIALDSQVHGGDPKVLRDHHPSALLGGPIARAAAGSTRLVVNLFDGGPRSTVSATIGRGGQPIQLAKVERRDPFVDEIYALNRDTKKPWVKSGLSSHVWQATLPADLPVGTRRVAVSASDEHGRQHTGWMVLEVTGWQGLAGTDPRPAVIASRHLAVWQSRAPMQIMPRPWLATSPSGSSQ